jgi:putative transposase
VETGSHLSRCLFYLDMNMVRAGVVKRPREWRFGGYHELAGNRKRYRIVDLDLLLSLLPSPNVTAFRDWYDTFTGDVAGPGTVRAAAGALTLDLPHLTRDVALRLARTDD